MYKVSIYREGIESMSRTYSSHEEAIKAYNYLKSLPLDPYDNGNVDVIIVPVEVGDSFTPWFRDTETAVLQKERDEYLKYQRAMEDQRKHEEQEYNDMCCKEERQTCEDCTRVGEDPPVVPSDPFNERNKVEGSLRLLADSFGFESVGIMHRFAKEVCALYDELDFLNRECDRITP